MSGSTELLLAPEVCRITGLTIKSIWRRRKAGIFPEPIKFPRHGNGPSVGWRRDQIIRWCESQSDPRVKACRKTPDDEKYRAQLADHRSARKEAIEARQYKPLPRSCLRCQHSFEDAVYRLCKKCRADIRRRG